MTNHYKTKDAWKSIIFYLFATCVVFAVCNFFAYIPILRTLSGELYDQFLADRIVWAFASSATFSFFFIMIGCFIVSLFHRSRPLNKSTLFLWSFVPYFLCTVLFGYLLFEQRNTDLDKVVPYRHRYSIDKEPFSAMEIALNKLYHQGDLSYYLYAVSIGFLILALYKGYRKHFLVAIRYMSGNTILYRESSLPSVEHADELIHKAEKLANTFANPSLKTAPEGDIPKIEVDFFAFIYGEGFDYVIINEGHTIPFIFEDGEDLDNFFSSIFLRINSTLYIRYDQIMLFNFEKNFIIISPTLEKVFENINRQNVKNKLFTYKFLGKPKGYYNIDPVLIPELKKKLKCE